MRDFFQFVFKCILGFFWMICDSSVNIEDNWKYILFGTIGGLIFLSVFLGMVWFINKYFFIRKNFLAEHMLLISFSSACILKFIYFAVTYIFCQ